MRALVLLVLLAGPALADPARLPDRVCVPTALLDQIAAYSAGQPWKDVAVIMARLQQVVAAREACSDPKDAPKPAHP